MLFVPLGLQLLKEKESLLQNKGLMKIKLKNISGYNE